MSEPSTPHPPLDPRDLSRAEELYLQALEGGGDGDTEELDLAQLCGRHPELAEELREVHAGWRWLEGFRPAEPAGQAPDGLALLRRLGARRASQRFQVEAEIGRGGMARVLRARDGLLGRVLALKVGGPPSSGGNDRATLRFLEEAQVMAQLDHPGVLPVHEVGLDEAGKPFFAMRLVEGEHLGALLARAHRGQDEELRRAAVRHLVRVCETVAFAHSRGVLHRDLKPSNVMVGRFGQCYVVDWGLARVRGAADRGDCAELSAVRVLPGVPDLSAVPSEPTTTDGATPSLRTARNGEDSDPLRTRAGAVLGTPSYMPPEQAEGDSGSVDERADVYAVGAMLYELLAGVAPYGDAASDEQQDVLEALRAGPPAPLPARADPELAAICRRAMARRPEDRYPDARALGLDLRAWLEHRRVSVVPGGPLHSLRKWRRRNPLASLAIAGAVLALVLGSVATAWSEARRSDGLERAGRDLARARDRADRSADLAHLHAAQGALGRGSAAEAERLLSRVPEERRDWTWRLVSAGLDTSVETWTDPERLVARSCAVDPVRGRLVVGTEDGRLRLWDLREQRLLDTLELDGSSVRALVHGPDGTLLAGTAAGRLWALDPGARTPRLLWSTDAALRDVAVDPRGTLWAAVSNGGVLARGSTGPQEDPAARVQQQFSRRSSVLFSPDGSLLLATDARNRLRVVSTESLEDVELHQLLPTHDVWEERAPARLTPDGSVLALGDAHGRLHLLDGTTFENRVEVQAHAARVRDLAVHPTQHLVALASEDHGVSIWSTRNGAPVLRGHGHRGPVAALAWDPTSGLLWSAGTDGTLRAWDPGRSAGTAPLPLPTEGLACVQWSADGTRLFAAGEEAPGLTVEAASGRVLQAWRGIGDGARALVPDPQGRWIAGVSGQRGLRWIDPTGEDSGWTPVPRSARPRDLLVDPHGRLLVAAVAEGLEAFDTERREPLWRVELDHPPTHLAWESDGEHLLVADEEGSLWRVRTASGTSAPELRHLLRLPSPATALAPHPDGQHLAVGDAGGNLHLFRDGHRRHSLEAHRGGVLGLAWRPGGELLASCGADHRVRLWHTDEPEEVLSLDGHGAAVRALAWRPDGERLASVGDDRRLLVWGGDPRDLPLSRASRALHRLEPGLRLDLEALGTARADLARLFDGRGYDEAERLAAWNLLVCMQSMPVRLQSALHLSIRETCPAEIGERAVPVALRLLELHPKVPSFQLLLALAELRAGRAARAAEVLEGLGERLGEMTPSVRYLHDATLALVLLALDRPGEAAEVAPLRGEEEAYLPWAAAMGAEVEAALGAHGLTRREP